MLQRNRLAADESTPELIAMPRRRKARRHRDFRLVLGVALVLYAVLVLVFIHNLPFLGLATFGFIFTIAILGWIIYGVMDRYSSRWNSRNRTQRHLALKPKEIVPTDSRALPGDGTAISVRLIHKQNQVAEEKASRGKRGRQPHACSGKAARGSAGRIQGHRDRTRQSNGPSGWGGGDQRAGDAAGEPEDRGGIGLADVRQGEKEEIAEEPGLHPARGVGSTPQYIIYVRIMQEPRGIRLRNSRSHPRDRDLCLDHVRRDGRLLNVRATGSVA